MLIQMKFSKNSKIEENSCMDVKKTAHPLGGLYNKFSPEKRKNLIVMKILILIKKN